VSADIHTGTVDVGTNGHTNSDPLGRLAAAGGVVPVANVPAVLDLSADAAALVVAGLAESGEVEIWNGRPDGAVVVLTPISAARFAITPALPPPADRPRKRRRRSPERLETDLFREGDGGLDRLVDQRAIDPGRASELWDHIPLPGCDPYPLKLIGLNVNPWLPRRPRRRPCPGCQGRRLSPIEVCLVEDCLRCGSDARIGRPRPDELPRPVDRADGLAGGKGGPPVRRRRGKGFV
jgi:hypothetical protein